MAGYSNVKLQAISPPKELPAKTHCFIFKTVKKIFKKEV